MPLWGLRLSLYWYVPQQPLGGVWPQDLLPPGGLSVREAPGDCVFPHPKSLGLQVNMLIGIIVFNKLMARDSISDKSKKQRAG